MPPSHLMGHDPGIVIRVFAATFNQPLDICCCDSDDIHGMDQQQVPFTGLLDAANDAGDRSPLRIGIVDRFNPESLTLFQQFRSMAPTHNRKNFINSARLHETYKALDKGLSRNLQERLWLTQSPRISGSGDDTTNPQGNISSTSSMAKKPYEQQGIKTVILTQ